MKLSEARGLVRAVLSEAAKAVEDLPSNVAVKVARRGGGNYAEITFWDLERNAASHEPTGFIKIMRAETEGTDPDVDPDHYATNTGPCDNAWVVSYVQAKVGWGPLLYDVAMELATRWGRGLASDRWTVSSSAHRVWRHYDKQRNDVSKHQLDNLHGQLTPDVDSDDCQQSASRKASTRWQNAPVSRRFTKKPKTVLKLKRAGKLVGNHGI